MAARMKMKIGPEEPERLVDQVAADDALEQPVERLDDPLHEVLRAAGDLRHPARRELREHDQADRDDPGDEHRVRHRKSKRVRDRQRTLRQAMFGHGRGNSTAHATDTRATTDRANP